MTHVSRHELTSLQLADLITHQNGLSFSLTAFYNIIHTHTRTPKHTHINTKDRLRVACGARKGAGVWLCVWPSAVCIALAHLLVLMSCCVSGATGSVLAKKCLLLRHSQSLSVLSPPATTLLCLCASVFLGLLSRDFVRALPCFTSSVMFYF